MSYSPFYFGPQSAGSSESVITTYTNASAITAIPQAQACSVNSFGLIAPIDVSSSSSWQSFVGYANIRISTSGSGPVITNGRLKNFTTGLSIGTALWVGTDGNPTPTYPSIGSNGFASGDMVIFMGVIVQNEDNPSAKDIALFTQQFGTL